MSTINVNNVMPVTGTTVNINGVTITDGVLSATTYENIPTVVFTGGTVEGMTEFTTGLNAGTISATTYENLPITQFTGGTVDGFTDFTNGLLATTMSATTFYGDGSNLTGISGGTNGIITVSVSELNSLISGNTLVAGSTYEITGVDVNLYSGNSIFLQAITTNELADTGSGLFFNPKYTDDTIWSNMISFNIFNIIGKFQYDEIVISNTNAIGVLKTYGMVEWVSGDWTSATTITGVSSTTQASIEDVTFSFYPLGDTVIWGGKKWVNVSGDTIVVTDEVLAIGADNVGYFFNVNNTPVNKGTLIITDGIETFTGNTEGVLTGDLGGYGDFNYVAGDGSLVFASPVLSGTNIVASYTSTSIGYAIDEYTLSSIWEPIPFNNIDYNVVLDEIKYDVVHDMIISRKDRFNNEVTCSYQSIIQLKSDFNLGNPIKDFQWGNSLDTWGYDSGLYFFSDYSGGNSNNGISDGGDDMYDGANEIYTDLGNVPYTHTRLNVDPDGGSPANLFNKDGVVVSGDTYFGAGSEYFTNLYPGLFTLHANDIQISGFTIDGNIGADGDGQYEVDEYVLTGFSTNYKVFVKKVYDAGDPSINHIMIVNTDDTNIIHEYDTSTEDDFDKISSISAATKIHYLLTSTFPGIAYITKEKIDEIVTTYLTLVDGALTTNDVLTVLNNNYETITNLLPVADTTAYRGVNGNYVNDSYLGCLNFNGGYIWNNNLTQRSYIAFNTFSNDLYLSSNISNNDLTGQSYIVDNFISNSSSIFGNHLNHFSYIQGNRFNANCDIEECQLDGNSYIQNNRFYNNSDTRQSQLLMSSSINSNVLTNTSISRFILNTSSRFQNNNCIGGNFSDNTITQNSSISYNTTLDSEISANNLMVYSQINENNLSGCTVSTNVLSNSSINFNLVNAYNFGNNANVNDNTLDLASINNNVLSGGGNSISSNYLSSNSLIGNNVLGANSRLLKNVLTMTSSIRFNNLLTQGYIKNNTLDNDSAINAGTFDLNARVEFCNLSKNSTFDLSSTPSIGLSINFINANHGFLGGDLTTATTVYSTASKMLMNNASDVPVLMFIDGSNVQQIVATNS